MIFFMLGKKTVLISICLVSGVEQKRGNFVEPPALVQGFGSYMIAFGSERAECCGIISEASPGVES